MTAEINLELQKAIGSNKLRRGEDEENLKKTDEIFVFKQKKSDFKETENKIVQSIIKDKNLIFTKLKMTIFILQKRLSTNSYRY